MGFVNQQQVERAEHRGAGGDRLDLQEQHGIEAVAAPEPGRVDAHRQVRGVRAELLAILRDEFLHVRDHADAAVPLAYRGLGNRSHQRRLAGARRQHQGGVAFAVAEEVPEGGEGVLLVITQLHGLTSCPKCTRKNTLGS